MTKTYFPKSGTEAFLTARDGIKIRYGIFPAEKETKATILLVNGHREFIEKYSEFIESLQARGYTVYAYDHRGQGLSGRLLKNPLKSHNPDFGALVRDMHQIVEEIIKPQLKAGPLYLIGHSLGGQICLRHLHDFPASFDKAILLAPFLDLIIGPKPIAMMVKFYFKLLSFLGFSELFAPGQPRNRNMIDHDLTFSQLTHDRERYMWAEQAIDQNPGLFIGGVTYGWLAGVIKSFKIIHSPGYTDAIKIPVLVLLAEQEFVVNNETTLRIFKNAAHVEIETIAGTRHEMYREIDPIRNRVLEKIVNFFSP
ncbi:MAG: alpha/beta hydrolase [Alphaproteobacteria bacterium]|nr:alpha/beta hydrolase [Alphaproteobacteria bacterium]